MFYLTKTQALKILQRRPKWNILRSLTQGKVLPQITIDKEGRKAEVILPGHSYTDLDRVVLCNVTGWLEAITKCRHLTWHQDFLQMNSKLRKDGMTFITGVRLSAPVHQPITRVLRESTSDFLFRIALGNVGSSSFETNGSAGLVGEKDEPLLVNYKLFWVYVDRNTRNVAKLPEWFVDGHSVCSKIPKSHRIDIADHRPPQQKNYSKDTGMRKVHEKYFVVDVEHIDKFKHTNHEVYINFIMDTVQEYHTICGNNDLPGVHKHITEFEVLYRGESNKGDSLMVELWTEGNQLIGYVINNQKLIVLSNLKLQSENSGIVSSKL